MALDFVKTNVVPGEPVTAQGWNALVDGLFEVESILKTGSGAVRVTIAGDQRDIDRRTVVATDAAGVRYEATRQAKAGDPFMFPKLSAGAYTVTVSAPGCTDAQASVTIANDGTVTPNPVPLALAFVGKRMPNVLGQKWKDAVASLQAINPRGLDAGGKGVPLNGFDADQAEAPVLMQWPDPEETIPAGKDPYVIIAATVKQPTVVTTPNFLGMTFAQAQAAAAQKGLIIKIV